MRVTVSLRRVLNRLRHWLRYRPEQRYMGAARRRPEGS
jgi:hypothetical protein